MNFECGMADKAHGLLHWHAGTGKAGDDTHSGAMKRKMVVCPRAGGDVPLIQDFCDVSKTYPLALLSGNIAACLGSSGNKFIATIQSVYEALNLRIWKSTYSSAAVREQQRIE
jgi:hypothetical protein